MSLQQEKHFNVTVPHGTNARDSKLELDHSSLYPVHHNYWVTFINFIFLSF